MFGVIRQQFKYGSYANFWDFLRDNNNFSNNDLISIVEEITEINISRPWVFGGGQVLDEFTHDLYTHFECEIWSACFGAAEHDQNCGPWGLSCLAKLEFSHKVNSQKAFEDFLVRNALKRAARDVLVERRQR